MAITNNFGQETINIGQEITASLLGVVYTIIDWVPRVIGVLIILIIGHYLAKGVKQLIKKVLKTIKFEDFMVKLKVTDMIKSQGVSLTISDIAVWLIYWLVFLAFISAAADVLAVPSITEFIAMVISYIPSIFAGLIIILLGIIAANTLSSFVKNFKGGDTYKQLVRWFILVIAFIAAIEQLGLDISFVTNNLFIILAGVMLAFGLAFGLGGRDKAREIIDRHIR
ncbi:MAG: hypothetical protein HOE19_00500 [Candidatus Komeilibacteria bacterium]|jgi:hypothetical protein|nr:hypothetical protein [Candidatus Komeilibacteria bacterium]MBT4447388.1 hypothetical protein [Candidatus Komeilibacteria bacterium]